MNTYWGSGPTQYFFDLTPEKVLDSLEELGLSTTGRCLTLNSMENRVYEIQLEDRLKGVSSIVAKYYRPGRWSREQIQDEHQFLFDLEEAEIKAIPPMKIENEHIFTLGDTGIHYSLFPKGGGRHFEDEIPESLERLGTTLARLHQVGRKRKAVHRHRLTGDLFARQVKETLLGASLMNPQQERVYESLVLEIAKLSDAHLSPLPVQRVHGDCHGGNILLNDQLFLVDFDDMLMAPKIQDLWMVCSGDEDERRAKRDRLATGYEVIDDYPYEQEKVIEILRSLRMIHYNGWIARRIEDQTFKDAFPYFRDESFWNTHIDDLRSQLELIHHKLAPF